MDNVRKLVDFEHFVKARVTFFGQIQAAGLCHMLRVECVIQTGAAEAQK